MIYRDGTKADYPKIKKLLLDTNYFGEVDPDTLGGAWLVAEHDGDIHATVWCFVSPPHAFIDYWVGSSKTIVKLSQVAEIALRQAGVKYVRGTIARDNSSALRLATEGLGMMSGANYQLVFKVLDNGNTNTNNDTRDDSTAGGCPGTVPDRTTPATSAADSGPTG